MYGQREVHQRLKGSFTCMLRPWLILVLTQKISYCFSYITRTLIGNTVWKITKRQIALADATKMQTLFELIAPYRMINYTPNVFEILPREKEGLIS